MTRSWWIERRRQVAGDLEDAVVALVRRTGRSARMSGKARTWPVRRTSPTQPSSRRRTGRLPGDVVGEAGPGGDLEAVVAERSGSSSRRPAGRASSRRRSSGRARAGRARRPGVRRSRGPCRGARRARPRARPSASRPARRPRPAIAGSASVRIAVAADDPPEDRAGRRWHPVVEVVGAASDGPSRAGGSSSSTEARAHVPMVAPRRVRAAPSRHRCRVRTMVPDRRLSLTVRTRPDYTPRASRALVAAAVRSRIRGQHTPRGRRSQSHRRRARRHHPETGPSRLLTADRDPRGRATCGGTTRSRGGNHALPEPGHRPTRARRQRRAAGQGRRPHRRRRRPLSARHRARRRDRPAPDLPALVAGRPVRRVRRAAVERHDRHHPLPAAPGRDPAARRPARQADRRHRRPARSSASTTCGSTTSTAGSTSWRSTSGAAGLLRRLGIEGAYRIIARNLRLPTPERYIDWEDVDPVETSIASIRLRVPHAGLTELHPADLATIIDQLAPRDRAGVLAALDDEAVADAIEEMEPETQVEVLEGLAPGARRRHPRGDVARRRRRPRRRPVGRDARGAARR